VNSFLNLLWFDIITSLRDTPTSFIASCTMYSVSDMITICFYLYEGPGPK
jgi:hypothetical protein